MITDALIIAAASAFIVSFVERWLDHPLLRGGVALLCSLFGVGIFGYSRGEAVVLALACSYVTLIMILVGERLASPPPLVVDNRRR